jgi:MFS family permease
VINQAAPILAGIHPIEHWRFYLAHICGFSLLCFAAAAIAAWSPAFLMRHYEWPVAQVGLVLGIMHMVAGAAGMLGAGLLADTLYRRGYLDAHLRLYMVVLPIFVLAGWLALSSSTITVSLIGLTIVSLLTPFIGVAATALQLTTSPLHRGKMSALFLLVYNLFGFGLGPVSAAWLAEHYLGGPEAIGEALAIVVVVAVPLSMACLALGMRPMRRAVAAVSAHPKTDSDP